MGFIFNGTRMEVKVADANKQWYVVHAFSGMEKTVSKNLEERIQLLLTEEFLNKLLNIWLMDDLNKLCHKRAKNKFSRIKLIKY